jgi:protease IV
MDIPKSLLALLQSDVWAIDIAFGLSQLSTAIFNISNGFDAKEIRDSFKSFDIEVVSDSRSDYGSGSSGGIGMIKVIPLVGTMFTEDQACGPRGMRSIVNEIYSTYNNTNYKGILIQANTGGGQSSAGKMLDSALQDKNKPVVVHANMLASAGIMGTINATEIIGDVHGEFGSIGSYISIDKDLIEYYKEYVDDIYADQSSNKNLEFREYIKGNKLPMQDYINKNAQSFIESVRPRLKGSEAKIAETLKGGMYDSKSAKSRGLLDSIGTRNFAMQRLSAHAKYY